mmetsp:Transcript_22070/g.42893  ORF Transcript_22070/g.42893 Transcript_22070/m.42893 type:complete len:261 (-) Transcript_22070:322-1104(-)
MPCPFAMFPSHASRAAWNDEAYLSVRCSISAHCTLTSSTRSDGPLPASTSAASRSSSRLPTARPMGSSLLVMTASVFLPARCPAATSRRPSSRLASMSLRKAPDPVLTSRSRASAPSAIFLDMMEDTISGRLLVVALTSRSAYIRLSTGATVLVAPVMQTPISWRFFTISSLVRLVLKPAIDSSLSNVPPVCPSPRPLIMGTTSPSEATSGASASETLSPTPPVECLSTVAPRLFRSRTSPLCTMAWVRCAVSSAVHPLM